MADNESQLKNDSTEETDRTADVTYRHRPKKIIDVEINKQSVLFRSENNISLRITIHTPDILQLKYILEDDQPSDFSYAIDPEFEPGSTNFELNESASTFELTTANLLCRISKKDMQVQFLDRDNNLLCRDKKPYFRRDTLMKGIQEVKISHLAPNGTAYFGLGDKATDTGLRGKSFENWNTDSYAYERGDDPLYRSIPFYSVLNSDGRAYGIFMDNPYRSTFDFDSNEKGTTTFSAAGGCMNYYFINGPQLTTVAQRYARLTGTPELPPMWGLGYHQCRWSYFPESRVRELADDFREKDIPCDAIYLDIDYMDDYRVFTWNNERFPDPKKLITDLKEQGFETIVMIDPGIKMDNNYWVYQQGLENDHFCKRPDGNLMIGPVWPPRTVFPDYTNPDTRNWWADLYKELMDDNNVSGVWNDMNEPAVFEIKKKTFPEDVRHYFDGHPSSHKKAHNIYGMQMARASYNGIKKYNKGKRPFLLTRANFSGGQRYAALWTGDNIADWDHLKLANEQCQRLSISGYSFVGTDIGGFVEDPSAELFTRWLQLGVFHPLFRNHTMGYKMDGASAVKEEEVELKKKLSDTDQEPWTFGKKYTEINRSVIELRYRLLNYLYTAFWQHVNDGTPILRPLAYYDQYDGEAIEQNDEFLFGDKILVSPVLDKTKTEVKTYFPRGEWYDFYTNHKYEGKSTQFVDAPISKIPFFVKAGTVLPLRQVMQYTQQHEQEFLELNVYFGETNTESQLYEDSEEGYDYTNGDYRLTNFQLNHDDQEELMNLYANRIGSYTPNYDHIKINFIGLPFEPASITVNGNEASFTSANSSDSPIYVVNAPSDFKQVTVKS